VRDDPHFGKIYNVKRFGRWLSNAIAALSLLLCLATIATWIESEFASDFAYRADSAGTG
jgi:hypothetical protein